MKIQVLGGTMLAVAAAMAFLQASGRADAQNNFNGYPCTQDCSGHQAGYEWAQQNGITSPSQCDGSSQSFSEGCQSYAEENAGSGDQDSDDDDVDDGSDDDGDDSE
jgi:hypothetical protein